MSYQFMHVEAYGRRAGAGKAGSHTIYTVTDEAERMPGACPHVSSPRPPVVVHGCLPREAAAVAARRADQAVDAKGRRFRADGLCLLTGVASYPVPRAELEADPFALEAYKQWEAATLAWAKAEYGDALASVVRHQDESHMHLHWYAVPPVDEHRRLRLELLHPGRQAAAEAKAAGYAKGQQNAAYKAAMRALQHRYFVAVGIPCGLTRLGPGRRRLRRDEWHAEQIAARSAAEAITHADAMVRTAKLEADAITRQAISAAQRATTTAKQAAKAKAEAIITEADQLAAERVRTADATARRRASRIIDKAKKEASATVASARRLGGWVHELVSWMKGEPVAERIKVAEEKITAEARQQVADAREALQRERQAKRSLVAKVSEYAARITELGAERDRLRTRVERYETSAPTPAPTLTPHGPHPTPSRTRV